MHENWDRLVGDLSERLQAAINSGDPTGLVDATALSQVQDLAEILTQDSRDAAAPDLIEALSVLVAVHWIRHQVLPEGQDQEDLQACQKWSAMLLPLAPHLVPEPMRAYLVGSDMPVSNSVAEAHQRGAALYDEYHRTGNIQFLETAIALFREAVGTAPASDPGRPAMLSNLGAALVTRFGRTGQQDR
jgi:hypothetical protein